MRRSETSHLGALWYEFHHNESTDVDSSNLKDREQNIPVTTSRIILQGWCLWKHLLSIYQNIPVRGILVTVYETHIAKIQSHKYLPSAIYKYNFYNLRQLRSLGDSPSKINLRKTVFLRNAFTH